MNPEEKNKTWSTLQICVFVAGISLVLYVAIFLAWNLTNPNVDSDHKPTSFWWDNKKQGYVKNPVDDRKKIED